MYATSIAVVLLPEEYDEFVEILRHDPTFPATHEAWLENRAKQDAHYLPLEPAPTHAIVHPDDLTDYCRIVAQSPSVGMLYATAAYKTQKKREAEATQ